jgi:glutathione S-transferase
MLTLYDFELSADCYKLRLLLSILGVPYEMTPVDVFPGREHLSDWYLTLSPEGNVPVLAIDGDIVGGSPETLLVHLAQRFDASKLWLANDADEARWLNAASRLSGSAGASRLAINFGDDVDLDAAQQAAHRELRLIDEHLWFGEREGRDWLGPALHPTVADLACFPDIALCEEGGISRQDYPAVRRWLDRVRRVRGFVTMSGVFPAAAAR